MLRIVNALFLFAGLCLHAQDSASAKQFIGQWTAKFKDKTICTIRLRTGDPISGQSENCNINVDEKGELQEPNSANSSDEPSPIINPKVNGSTLTFEEKDGDDVMKFEFTITGDNKAELKIIDGPVAVKPILFLRQQG